MKSKLLSFIIVSSLLCGPMSTVMAHADPQPQQRQAPVAQADLPDVTPSPALSAYARLPLAFIPNQGQLDERVGYYTQAGNHALWFTADGVTLALPETTLRLTFVDANPDPQVEGGERLPGVVNYFIGNDPARWRTRLPTYGAVTYRDLWSGVDVVYQGHNGALKSTLTVAPGADPTQIQLAYPEADNLSVDEKGSLVIRIGEAEIRESPPVAWQEIADRKLQIAAVYQVAGDGRSYGFALSLGYDPAYPLVIDPELRYSTFLGGSNSDGGGALVVDQAGNAYVAGSTSSSNFPTTPGAYDTVQGGGACGVYTCPDAFVAKLNANGTGLAYATFLGGSDNDDASAIAVDEGGNVYIAGLTLSSNFPTTPGAFDTSHNGESDVFVVKLNANGTALEYATFLGSSNVDVLGYIAVDTEGNAYVTGTTPSADFPTTPGAFDTSYGGGTCSGGVPCGDAFVVKLNAAGTGLGYATFLGGSSGDGGRAIAVDEGGSAYVTGGGSPGFPTTPGAYDPSYNGVSDVFVVKLNANGTGLDYATFLGGISSDDGEAIAVDGTGNAYVCGFTYSSAFPTTASAFDTSHNGGMDAFVAKLSANGANLDYATYLGGSGSDSCNAIAVDEAGTAYVTGGTNSPNFPTTVGAYDTSPNGGYDAFVTLLSADGADVHYGTLLGGNDYDSGNAIATDGMGSAYVAGSVSSTSGFPTTPGAYDVSHNGGSDAFVLHLTLLSYLLAQGDLALTTGRQYRANFHAELGGPASVTISQTLANYAQSGLLYLDRAESYYEAAVRWADSGTATRALEGLLNTRWESATGAMLSGNEFMVLALDVKFENPSDPLLEEIGQLQEAINWYARATDGYSELLASQYYTSLMTLQSTRIHPISGQPAPYLDLQRLALAAAKKSRAYLELAERQFRRFTPASKAEAEATLRRGSSQATTDLALLEKLWTGAVNDASYQELLRNLSDMQRLFRYLQEDKNPFGYGPEYVPFYFQPKNLPANNFEQTMPLAQAEWAVARDMVNEAQGRQQQSDDNYVILHQRLTDVVAKYDAQLIQLCGADPADSTRPDLEKCHENQSGEMYRQILRITEANLRIQLVEQQMINQLELIRIEQERAARVAGVRRATAVMYTETGERLADLAEEEAKLRNRRSWTERITGFVSGVAKGAAMGAPFAPPFGAIAGGIIGGLSSAGQMFEEDAAANRMGDLAAKRERLQAQQNAYVQYAEAEIEDANSEALIKQYMLRFTEYDIELSIATNNLQQEIARLNGLKTQVEYLAAEKKKALAFTENLYQDPAGRVLRDYYMELANDRFDVALRYAWQTGRALAYEVNQDSAFTGSPLNNLDDVYHVRDVTTLQAALAQMNTAYNDFLARPDVPTPQQREDVIFLSQALGFADAYDADLRRIVTRKEKFNAFVRDPANRDAQGNLSFTFQTAIFVGNPFFSTGVFNDKITSIQMRLRGRNLGNDRAIISLRQDGTSFIRTLSAFRSGGPDDVREYNVSPLKATITAATNDSMLDPTVALNQELATRSVAFTNWTLTLDRIAEPENRDVDINGIEEIEIKIRHETYTLQTLFNAEISRLSEPSVIGVCRIKLPQDWSIRAQAASAPAGAVLVPASSPAPLTGNYVGTVVVNHPTGLSPLDLAIVLTDTNGSLSGYIDSIQALAYPVIGGGKGLTVTGTWSGTHVVLRSSVFTDTSTGASRQMVLHTGVISDDGEILTGVYSETLWGLTPLPLVMVGEFRLTRPSHLPQLGQPVELQVRAMSTYLKPLSSTLVIASLVDFYSNPISQTQVGFSATSGTVAPVTATTNITGEAFVTFTAGPMREPIVITATAAGLTGTVQVKMMEANTVYLPLILKSF